MEELKLILNNKTIYMKYILGIIATALMIWSLLDKSHTEFKIYAQIVGVILFFYVMMRLMDKTPSNFDKKEEDEDQLKDDENGMD